MFNKDYTYKPFKIEIERNTNVTESEHTPFFISINGKRLEGVKRFYIDLDCDKIIEQDKNNRNRIYINPWVYGVEYKDYPDENIHT